MPNKYVLDCSVALKWFLDDEDLTEEAELILVGFLKGDIELVAPSHLPYEFGFSLQRAVIKTGKISEQDAKSAFKNFLDLNIRIEHQDAAELHSTWILNTQLSENFYDTAYVTLAKQVGCEWLTADGEFPSNRPEVLGFVKHLSSFGLMP